MESLSFKTSLKCNGCVNAIRDAIQSIPEIQNWEVELESPDKILRIEASRDVTSEVLDGIKKAGYEISRL